MNPNVAIIISNYNYGEYVLEAINSALNQTYQNIRVYVLDDGSSDDSWEKISSITEPEGFRRPLKHQALNTTFDLTTEEMGTPYYEGPIERRHLNHIVYAYKINNSGASTARNVAMWEAWEWADIFGILDADDVYKSQKVEVLTQKLMEHPEIGVTYADYEIHRTYGHANYIKHEYKLPYDKRLLENQCIVHSGALIKKDCLQHTILKNGEIFDSNLHGPASQGFIGCTEDYDLWLRLSNVCMIIHVPEPLSIVRETGQNQSMKMTNEIFQHNVASIRSR